MKNEGFGHSLVWYRRAGMVALSSYFEARAFNNTTWDAMWINLRVER